MTNDIELDDIDDNSPDASKQLRQFATSSGAKAAAAEAQATQLARENAVLRAGIDTTTRQGKAWLDTYTGDMADQEALVADAKEFGLAVGGVAATPVADPAIPADGEVIPATNTGTAERNALGDGAQVSQIVQPDPAKAAVDLYQSAVKAGAPQDEARAAAFSSLSQSVLAELSGQGA